MRECKPSDIQALDVIHNEIRDISTHIAMLNGRLIKLYKEVAQYQSQQGEAINVETTKQTE
jgi:hypothetical protein